MPDAATLATRVTAAETSINLVWMLVCAFLVMFMQAGFALVETGLTRAKNAVHTMGMNLFVYAIGVLGFWAVGFALQMGGVGALGTLGGDTTLARELGPTLFGHHLGLVGAKGFFLGGESFTAAVAATFLFQMVFMDTAATIPTGAMAERWRFSSFVLYSVVITTVIYPLYANWVWGGGWLSQLGAVAHLGHGHVDFAGSSVVHLTGGVLALVGAKLIGARRGKYGPRGDARPIPGHNIPMVATGTFILAFGWFGFNAGSTLAGTDARIAVVATNTMLASAAGCFTAWLAVMWKFKKPDVTMMCNGLLAGLVAVTAPCAFVPAWAAVVIGGVGGVLVVVVSLVVERRLRIDDPVGAVAVHGANGLWGALAVGLFADGTYGLGLNGVEGGVRGLFYGDGGQLAAQAIAVVANLAWVAPTGWLSLRVIDRLVGNRVHAEDEVEGLDVPEMGLPAYGAGPGRHADRAPEAQHAADDTDERQPPDDDDETDEEVVPPPRRAGA